MSFNRVRQNQWFYIYTCSYRLYIYTSITFLIPNTPQLSLQHQYWQEPEFCTSKHNRKAHRSISSGQMTCTYTVCCWSTTSSNIITDHNSVKGCLKVIDCIVLSVEYWCPNRSYSISVSFITGFQNETKTLLHNIRLQDTNMHSAQCKKACEHLNVNLCTDYSTIIIVAKTL